MFLLDSLTLAVLHQWLQKNYRMYNVKSIDTSDTFDEQGKMKLRAKVPSALERTLRNESGELRILDSLINLKCFFYDEGVSLC